MQNFFDFAKEHPELLRQYSSRELLFLRLDCPPDSKATYWVHHNCFVHVLGGQKRLSTSEQSWQLGPGNTIFVKKGAHIVEKIGKEETCLLLFYIPDEYIRSFVNDHSELFQNIELQEDCSKQVMEVNMTPIIKAFYQSVVPYFTTETAMSEAIVELKFRELLLSIISSGKNKPLTCYFYRLWKYQNSIIKEVMINNCLYNLHLNEYARMCNRSLASFKRDFFDMFGMPPGRWLMEKRLEQACRLLLHSNKTVFDIALETGFTNLSHFDRVFKKHYGLSPLRYRYIISKTTTE